MAKYRPDALWDATESDHDAVLLDVKVPKMTGIEVRRQPRNATGGCQCGR